MRHLLGLFFFIGAKIHIGTMETFLITLTDYPVILVCKSHILTKVYFFYSLIDYP